ncbi:MAG: phosphatase PAP2 family protein [Dehalococcoidia bacterium]
MATEATYTPGAPAQVQKSLSGLKIVLTAACRVIFLVLAVLLMAAMRFDEGIVKLGFFFVAALLALYLALGLQAMRVWAPYATALLLFVQLRSLADGLGMPVQFAYPAEIEKALFFGALPTVWLQERLYTFAHLGPVEVFTIGVYLSYFFVPHAMAVALWKFDNEHFKTYGFAFVATLYIGLLTCAVLPTAPPWMAAQLGHIPHVYQVLPDIAGNVMPGTYENAYEVAGANPVAAMPSLHAAIPFLMAIALWKYRWLRWLGAAYAVSMLFAITYLGEHYVVDGLAGWVVAGAAWAGVSAVVARRNAGRTVNAAPPQIAGEPPPEPADGPKQAP